MERLREHSSLFQRNCDLLSGQTSSFELMIQLKIALTRLRASAAAAAVGLPLSGAGLFEDNTLCLHFEKETVIFPFTRTCRLRLSMY